MAYCGPVIDVRLLPSARSNRYGWKAVVITRKIAPNGVVFDSSRIVSKTFKTREEAMAKAERTIRVVIEHLHSVKERGAERSE